MDTRLKHPLRMIIGGPSESGKTSFVKRFLQSMNEMVNPTPSKILYFYSMYQPAYDEMRALHRDITFVQGLPPDDIETLLDKKYNNLIILDDMMTEIADNPTIGNLFLRGSHHLNLSVIYLVQNIFPKGKQCRNISLNASYMVLFRNPRDKAQIGILAKQMYPGNTKFFMDSFEDATLQPFGYLFLDLKTTTPEVLKIRTNIFPEEQCYVYLPPGKSFLMNTIN